MNDVRATLVTKLSLNFDLDIEPIVQLDGRALALPDRRQGARPLSIPSQPARSTLLLQLHRTHSIPAGTPMIGVYMRYLE